MGVRAHNLMHDSGDNGYAGHAGNVLVMLADYNNRKMFQQETLSQRHDPPCTVIFPCTHMYSHFASVNCKLLQHGQDGRYKLQHRQATTFEVWGLG